MLTYTATITFGDNSWIAGQITVDSPTIYAPISYRFSAPADGTRIMAKLGKPLPDQADVPYLRALMQNFATAQGGQFFDQSAGDYDLWAE